jgi:hypothetical protein
MARFAPAVALLLLGAAQMPLLAATPAPVRDFDPTAFFTGPTEGHGSLKKVFSSSQATHVTGFGTMHAEGLLVIDQTVVIEREETASRHWEIRETRPGTYSGTISDAKGQVVGSVSGNTMQINYKTRNGLSVAQLLTVAPDGRSLHNAMKVRKFGIVFATIDETIRKL